MSEDRNSYRNITKAIGLFGGVQVFQIIISIVKNKIVALLLGPFGMGVLGMITSTTALVSSLTSFGLQTSSVRDVSKSYSTGKENEVIETVSVLKRLIILTGLLGMLVVFFFSKYLSIWAFDSPEYNVAFKIVAVVLFIDQLCIGQKVLMQGTFHYKYMAKASLLGSIVGLVLTVPMYYLWELKAIVPVIIVTSLINLVLSSYFSNKIHIKNKNLSIRQIFYKGRTMIILGLAIALTGVVSNGQVYILRLFISNYGSIDDVGLYTAGIAIANSYIGVVLTAMASDYSPRLASVSGNNTLFIETINRQMRLLVTLITPLILIFIVFIKQWIILLYSTKFVDIIGMVEWIMFGMFFRAVSWSMSYGYVARGDAKLFFWNEFITSIYSLGLSILGYVVYGFEGMGIAFCLTYVLYSIQLYVLSKKRFGYNISTDTFSVIFMQILMSSVLFVLLKILGYSISRYVLGFVGFIIITYFSYRYLNIMIDLKSVISSLKNRIQMKK